MLCVCFQVLLSLHFPCKTLILYLFLDSVTCWNLLFRNSVMVLLFPKSLIVGSINFFLYPPWTHSLYLTAPHFSVLMTTEMGVNTVSQTVQLIQNAYFGAKNINILPRKTSQQIFWGVLFCFLRQGPWLASNS